MGRGGENFENFECCLKSMVYRSRVPKVLDLYHVCIYVNHYKQRVCGHSNFTHIPASFGTQRRIIMSNRKIHHYSHWLYNNFGDCTYKFASCGRNNEFTHNLETCIRWEDTTCKACLKTRGE